MTRDDLGLFGILRDVWNDQGLLGMTDVWDK